MQPKKKRKKKWRK